MGSGKTPFFFLFLLFLSMPPILWFSPHSALVSVYVSDILCGFIGLHPKCVSITFTYSKATWLCMYVLYCIYVLARKLCLCVHVHKYLFILAPVLRHICLLSVTRLKLLLRVFFVLCYMDPKKKFH